MSISEGAGIQVWLSAKYFDLHFPNTVRKWQDGWFYCLDERMLNAQEGLPAYIEGPPELSQYWKANPSREEIPMPTTS